jgi:ABC-type sugar transport system ATPase subunit
MPAGPAARPRATATPAIRCVGVGRSFGATRALDGIDLEVEAGSVHALVGQNGAGKSTLLGILAGRIAAGEGYVEVFGEPVPPGPREARAHGIAAIYQELTTVPALSAAENVFLGRQRSRRGVIAAGAMRREFRALCGRLGREIEPDVEAGTLSVADQQMLEIMRAVQSEARVILFDEPTAALAAAERAALYRLVRELRSDGVTMILVSHNLDEVLDLADTTTVFRNGRLQASGASATWTKGRLVDAMLGEQVGQVLGGALSGEAPAAAPAPRRRGARAADVLRAEAITVPGVLHGVDLAVRPGEVLGIAGLVGSGRTTLLRALAGLEPSATGAVTVGDRTVPCPTSARSARALGIALVPEDRKTQGLVLSMSVKDNIAMGDLGAVARAGTLSEARTRAAVADIATDFGLDPSRLDAPVATLSGGNQQKALLARWGFARPRVLLADEPTRGIDVGAKREIADTLRRFVDQGVGVVMVSSELEEVIAIADRIVVLAGGQAVDVVDAAGSVSVADILNIAFRVEVRP